MNKFDLPAPVAGARPGVNSAISSSAAKRWNPCLSALAGPENAATISIMGPIGGYYEDGVTAKRIEAALRSIGGADVVVHINSPGGDVFEGLAIYNLFRGYEGQVTMSVLGLAASAASFIAMAGDQVEIARSAFFMIHNTWVVAQGDRHAFREVAEWLEPFDAALADIYVARSGVDGASIAAKMDRETWIGGPAAVDMGLADALLEGALAEDAGAQASGDMTPLQAARRLEALLAGNVPRADRRALVAALQTNVGTQDAAPDGTQDAAILKAASELLGRLDTY